MLRCLPGQYKMFLYPLPRNKDMPILSICLQRPEGSFQAHRKSILGRHQILNLFKHVRLPALLMSIVNMPLVAKIKNRFQIWQKYWKF